MDQEELQLVLFEVAGEVYGVDIAQVREIIEYPRVTRIPDSPEYVEGIINLRGHVISVINLRRRFGLIDDQAHTQHVIILELRDTVIGVTVDGVTQVYSAQMSDIEPPPRGITMTKSEYVIGVAKMGERVALILNADQAFGQPDLVDVVPEGGADNDR